MKTQNAFSASILLLVLLFISPFVSAAEKEINSAFFGGAIKGYDPVAYFTEGKAVKGDGDYEVDYKGATWRFSSEKNRAAFQQTPEKYAPQYGGYCAYAVSQGYTASIDPQAWSIVEGKLYLNYSLEVREIWKKDIAGHIAKANANWPQVLNK